MEVRSLVLRPESVSEPITVEGIKWGSALLIRLSHSSGVSRPRTTTDRGVSAREQGKELFREPTLDTTFGLYAQKGCLLLV